MGPPIILVRLGTKYRLLLLASLWCAVTVADQCEQPDAQISLVQKKALKLIHAADASELKKRAHSISNPSCLQEDQKKSLIDKIRNDMSLNVLVDGLASHVDMNLDWPNASGGVLWLSYHKSGYGLMGQLKNIVAPIFGANNESSILSLFGSDFFRECYALPMENWARRWRNQKQCNGSFNMLSTTTAFQVHVHTPRDDWPVPGNVRLVFSFRDPIKLVLSAYRYHAADKEEWESSTSGFGVNSRCLYCAKADYNLLFSACPNKSNKYSYLDLLSSYPEEDGVMVEFIRARNQMQMMLENLKRWMNDRNALVLSVEHFETDFNQTATCLLRFLGLKEDAKGYSLAVAHLQEANPDSPSFAHPKHKTSGHYDNSNLEKIFREHPILGPPFAEIRAAADLIYQRQFETYGCPTPSL